MRNQDLGTGEKLSLVGFMAVNRDKAKALPAEKLAKLDKTDELELLYLHLTSMRSFPTMANRMAGTGAVKEEGSAPDQKKPEEVQSETTKPADKKSNKREPELRAKK